MIKVDRIYSDLMTDAQGMIVMLLSHTSQHRVLILSEACYMLVVCQPFFSIHGSDWRSCALGLQLHLFASSSAYHPWSFKRTRASHISQVSMTSLYMTMSLSYTQTKVRDSKSEEDGSARSGIGLRAVAGRTRSQFHDLGQQNLESA